eukprot:TRINITY_DN26406_c0_g1_i1.p1 TRINITY_DN26406_c0_g1~~TRINITY_DN26406_c0_g1_i1.p1  ORF type:complete len:1169 (+),score=226.47 TRINITY_DN26406_c0_g1_i1:30-3536(+)
MRGSLVLGVAIVLWAAWGVATAYRPSALDGRGPLPQGSPRDLKSKRNPTSVQLSTAEAAVAGQSPSSSRRVRLQVLVGDSALALSSKRVLDPPAPGLAPIEPAVTRNLVPPSNSGLVVDGVGKHLVEQVSGDVGESNVPTSAESMTVSPQTLPQPLVQASLGPYTSVSPLRVSRAANAVAATNGSTRTEAAVIVDVNHDLGGAPEASIPLKSTGSTSKTPTLESSTGAVSGGDIDKSADDRPKSFLAARRDIALGLVDAIDHKRLNALQRRLAELEAMLYTDPSSFDVGQPFIISDSGNTSSRSGQQRPRTFLDVDFLPLLHAAGASSKSRLRLGPCATPGAGMTMLAASARAGWMPGVKALLDWEASRLDHSLRMDLDSDGCGGSTATPLLHAARSGHAEVVEFLLGRGASPLVADTSGDTPLEVAVKSASPNVVDVLLSPATALAGGLAALRGRLWEDARSLPSKVDTFSSEDWETDPVDRLRRLVPACVRPDEATQMLVGNNPNDWVLLHMNRVMAALAQGADVDVAAAVTRKDARKAANVTAALAATLSAHGFDSFGREFSKAVMGLGFVGALFVALTFAVFRLRIYGGMGASVSLAPMLFGAFDPVRLTDPDFDPCRQRLKLPYRSLRDKISPRCRGCSNVGVFASAFLGVYSSWLLQFVRIPPEKDLYDEDYASDDDETSRLNVRDRCARYARYVRCSELVARNLALASLLAWFGGCAGRYDMLAALLAGYVGHSIVLSCVAASAVPAEVPEDTACADDNGDDSCDPLMARVDAARLVHALFGTQYGPRWARAICTTRSTASPNKTSVQRRRRKRMQQGKGALTGGLIGASASLRHVDEPVADNEPSSDSGANFGFSDAFQKAFLQVDLMHTSHGEFLFLAVGRMLVVFLTLLWLAHGGHALGCNAYLWPSYRTLAPSELFGVYGAPGSLKRWIAIGIELLLLGLVAERLCDVVALLHAAVLSLKQRRRALDFVVSHVPPRTVARDGGDRRLDEAARCIEFALELSSLRWFVLRGAVVATVLIVQVVLLFALLTLAPIWEDGFREGAAVRRAIQRVQAVVNPVGLIAVGSCFTWPLVTLMADGALGNQKLRTHVKRLLPETRPLASDGEPEVAAIREVLRKSLLCWPGGRELGLVEVGFLLAFNLVAWGVGVRSLLPRQWWL